MKKLSKIVESALSEATTFKVGETVMVKMSPGLGSKKMVPTEVKLVSLKGTDAAVKHHGQVYNIQLSRLKKTGEPKYEDLVKKTLRKPADQKKFMAYVKKTYGRKWWSEWEGYSDKEIKANIKEVFAEI